MPRFTTVDGVAEDVVGLDGRDLGSGARYHLHPDCCIRRVLAMIARARLRMAGVGIAPGIETSADRRTDHDLFRDHDRDQVAGVVHAIFGPEARVFETIDPGCDGVPDPRGAVGIGGDRQPVPVGLLDRRVSSSAVN